MHVDVDRMREFIRNSGYPEVPAYEVIDRLADFVAANELDTDQIVRHIGHRLINAQSRGKTGGRRNAEIVHIGDGERRDAPFEQLTLLEAEQVTDRKGQHAYASLRAWRADMAVLTAAQIEASRRGLRFDECCIADVLTDAQIEVLRTDAEAAA